MGAKTAAAKAGRKKRDTKQLWAFGFCLPNIVFFIIWFVIPAVIGLMYSFTNYNGFKKMDFVGLSNYEKLFRDRDFYMALLRTMLYTVVSVPLIYIVSLLFGLLLSAEKIHGMPVLRVLVYWPVLLSAIMVGLVWRWLFGETFGFINYVLQAMGGSGVHWATNSTAAFFTTIIASVWSGCGTNMLIFIGALKQISVEQIEAARLDGANRWQVFLHVKLPELRPVSFMVVLLSTISSFKVFAMVQSLTNGGPGTATTYMIQYIYTTGFTKNKVGYASAASMVLFLILMLLSIIQTKATSNQD